VGVFIPAYIFSGQSMERPWLNFYEEGVPHSIEVPELTLGELFSEAVTESPEHQAVSFFGKKFSYRTLGLQVEQFAHALSELGVKKGDRVAILLPNIPQYPVVHFGALKIGAILVPTNPLYVERELTYQLVDSGAETIVTLDSFYSKIANIKSETSLKRIIVTRLQEYLPATLKLIYPIKSFIEGNRSKVEYGSEVFRFQDLLAAQEEREVFSGEVKNGDTAMFLYTGGTTGLSKGAILTHSNLVANVMQIRLWYNRVDVGEEAVLCALPFFHSYGLTTCLHLAVLLRSKMILIPNPRDIKTVLKTIQKEKASLFSGVPTLYVAINNHPQVERYDLSSIKCCVSGGAPLPLSVAKQFEELSGGRLVEGYGLSETSPVTHANPIRGKRIEGSIGLPMPSTDAMIVDPETKKPLRVGQVGELAVQGPQVMQGYWQKTEETDMVLQEDWLYTGDLAKIDDDGYFYIVDRQKDMIIAGGFNIFPREIEDVLFEHDKVLEAAVIGVEDEYRGETVKAFIVTKPGEVLTEREIISFCKQRLAPFKVPKLIEFRESLPKSNIGKILRRVLKEEEGQKENQVSQAGAAD